MAPPAKRAARPLSAYMLFAEEQRGAVMQQLRAAAPDGKAPVTAAAKALGERWKALGEEGQAAYRERVREQAAAAAEAAAARVDDGGACSDGGGADGAGGVDAPVAAAALPRGIVKRVMLSDDDVKRVTGDAVWLVAEAAALFLGRLAAASGAAAAAAKRRTVRLDDFEHVVRRDRRLVEAGLKDVASAQRALAAQAAATKLPPRVVAEPGGDGSDGGDGAGAGGAEPGSPGGGAHGQQPLQARPASSGGGCAEDGAGEPTDEQRIAAEEARAARAAEAAKARAAKAAERRAALAAEEARGTRRITVFFVSGAAGGSGQAGGA